MTSVSYDCMFEVWGSAVTTASYDDYGAPENGDGRYYRCVLNATGAAQQISSSDRGHRIGLITRTKTVAMDILLGVIALETVDLDAILKATDTKVISLDTLLRALGITETVDLDVRLGAISTKTIDLDILLKAFGITETVDLDVILGVIPAQTVALDVILVAYPEKALRYVLEIHQASTDNLIAILNNAHGINFSETINEAPTLRFELPGDDAKAADIIRGNEVWLRNYKTDEIMAKFRLIFRRDVR